MSWIRASSSSTLVHKTNPDPARRRNMDTQGAREGLDVRMRKRKMSEGPQISMEDVPMDIQSRILSYLNWSAYPSAALTCKTWSKMVKRRQQSMSWSYDLIQGPPKEFGVRRDKNEEFGVKGITNLVMTTLENMDYLNKQNKPEVAIIFATSAWSGYLEAFAKQMLKVLPSGIHLIGLLSNGIIGTSASGNTVEIEEEEGIAISLVHVQEGRVFSAIIEDETYGRGMRDSKPSNLDDFLQEISSNIDNLKAAGLVREKDMSKIFSFVGGDSVDGTSTAIDSIHEKFPNSKIMGGLCGVQNCRKNILYSAPKTRANADEKLWYEYSTIILFLCNQIVDVEAYRGLKQLASDYKITGSDQGLASITSQRFPNMHTITQMQMIGQDGEAMSPPLCPCDAVMEIAEILHGLPANFQFGVKHQIKEARNGDTRTKVEVMQIQGLSRTEGSICVSNSVELGQVASFFTCTADESKGELLEILESIMNSKDEKEEPSGVFLIICGARGSPLYFEENVESKIIKRQLPDTPIMGFFANGEIGPIPFREYRKNMSNNTVLQGYTSIIGVCGR